MSIYHILRILNLKVSRYKKRPSLHGSRDDCERWPFPMINEEILKVYVRAMKT